MDRRKLIQYLLLNIFVSASVTGGILFWYDRNYRSTALSSVQPAPVTNSGSAPQATLNPQVDIPVEIVSVIGAGTLNAEWVVVRNAGTEPLSLSGWQLKDSNRNVFTFPNLTLNTGGAFTGRGTLRPHHYIAAALSRKSRRPVKIPRGS